MSLVNQGVFCINRAGESPAQKTIVVFGVPRSGTTMVSKLLSEIGVDMGNSDNVVAEDTELANMLEKDFSESKLKAYIEDRNAKSEIWGWKRPEAFRYRNRFVHQLKNPHFVFMFRDPLAIALREHISMNEPVLPRMKQTMKRYEAILKFAESCGQPCLLVSYEKAIQAPEELIDQLADFTGTNPSGKDISKAVSLVNPNDQSYLTSTTKSRQRLRGVVEKLTTNTIEGWAAYAKGTEIPILDCITDDDVILTIKPKIDRPDLEERLLGNTIVGFKAEFPLTLGSGQINRLKVVDKKLGSMLRMKPKARN